MAELKTKPSDDSVSDFLDSIEDEEKRADSRKILNLMREVTGAKPVMWGSSIIGFGDFHYRYKSGREGDWFLTGFSPRKQALTLYLMSGFDECGSLLQRLGTHKIGKGCLYIKKLDDVDVDVLKELVTLSVKLVQQS